jgi:hypothetical protein
MDERQDEPKNSTTIGSEALKHHFLAFILFSGTELFPHPLESFLAGR